MEVDLWEDQHKIQDSKAPPVFGLRQPKAYRAHSSDWDDVKDMPSRNLARGSVLEFLSWNIDECSPDPPAR